MTQTSASVDRVAMLGFDVDRMSMQETVATCCELIDRRVPARQLSLNAAIAMAARTDSHLRQVISESDIINADGQPLIWLSRWLNDPLPERVAGVDLMLELLGESERRGYRVFLLGGRPEVVEAAMARARAEHPRLEIDGRHGYFTDEDLPEVAETIRTARPDLLFVGLGTPAQEHWVVRAGRLGVPLAIAVGGSFDVLAGVKQRAPVIWQRLGLEWLYRMRDEPARYGKRYLRAYPRFILASIAEVLRRRLRRL